jgi:hypothetical protein
MATMDVVEAAASTEVKTVDHSVADEAAEVERFVASIAGIEVVVDRLSHEVTSSELQVMALAMNRKVMGYL